MSLDPVALKNICYNPAYIPNERSKRSNYLHILLCATVVHDYFTNSAPDRVFYHDICEDSYFDSNEFYRTLEYFLDDEVNQLKKANHHMLECLTEKTYFMMRRSKMNEYPKTIYLMPCQVLPDNSSELQYTAYINKNDFLRSFAQISKTSPEILPNWPKSESEISQKASAEFLGRLSRSENKVLYIQYNKKDDISKLFCVNFGLIYKSGMINRFPYTLKTFNVLSHYPNQDELPKLLNRYIEP